MDDESAGAGIVLIGFMGAGKSSAGRELAKRTGLPLHETDRLVSGHFGLPIAEVFSRHGEEAFRDCENSVLAQLPPERMILVTGGGIILRSENVARIRRLGGVINLTADEGVLFARATRSDTRPLLKTADPRATFALLLRQRASKYRDAADVTIDTTSLTVPQVAEAILAVTEKLKRNVACP